MDDSNLLETLKALADHNRLRILGLLARQPYAVEQLAALLDLRASTVSHHLARLAHAGLVSAQADGYYSVYRLELDTLQSTAQTLLTPENLEQLAEEVDLTAYDRRVLGEYLRDDGKLSEIPTQPRKRAVVFRHLLDAFKPGQQYSETQVDEILARFHPDAAPLRLELVRRGWLAREGSIYQRVQELRRGRDQSASWSVW
ncbi:MAG: metalloregulator ArsR/SmtB family transcription factor [Anaerolineales bacterium]